MVLNFILALAPIIWLIIALSILKMPGYRACVIAAVIAAVLSIQVEPRGCKHSYRRCRGHPQCIMADLSGYNRSSVHLQFNFGNQGHGFD